QAASTGGICPCLRRVAGCATPTGSAGHASATASLKLTFHLDHSVGANQPPPGGRANGSPLAPKNALIFNRAPIDPNRPLVPPYDGLVRETDAKTLNHVMVRGVGTR